MSEPLLWLVTICYGLTAIDLFWGDKIPLAIVFAAYMIANVGLIMAIKS